MSDSRPTRWQKARSDWSGIRLGREGLVGLVGGVLAAAVQALAGSGGAVDTLIAAGVGVVAAVIVVPLAELAWNWIQAPMRLLTEDVIAIRKRVEAAPTTDTELKPPVDVRLALINHKRVGDELKAEDYYSPFDSEVAAQGWTNSVIDFLSEHVPAADVECFMTAGAGTSRGRMEARLGLLGELIERLGGDGHSAGSGEGARELREDRQVGMEPDAGESTDPEGKE